MRGEVPRLGRGIVLLLLIAACGGSDEGAPAVDPAPTEAVPGEGTASEEADEPAVAEEPPTGSDTGGTATFTIDGVTTAIPVDCHFAGPVVAVVAPIRDPTKGAELNSSISTLQETGIEVWVGDELWSVSEVGGEMIQLDIDQAAGTIAGAATFTNNLDDRTSTGVFSIECG